MDQAWGLQNLFSAPAGSGQSGGDVFHQAAGLASFAPQKPRTRTITVAAGKGGVGKTTVAVNLAMAMSMTGRDVLLLDADMSVANVDVQLGLSTMRHVGHMLEGECSLQDLIITGPRGLKIVPGGSGARRLAQLCNGEHAAVIQSFDKMLLPPEFLFVDTPAGVADNVAMFAAAADEVIVVVCDEPASITDAYALMKILSQDFGVRRFRVVTNMVRNLGEAKQLYGKLARVSERFLDISLHFMGMVPHDERLRQAIRRQVAVVDMWPSSRSAMEFKKLAGVVDTWDVPLYPDLGRIAFFSGQNTPAGGW